MTAWLAAMMLALGSAAAVTAEVVRPPAIVVDGVPPVPDALAVEVRPYLEYRTASFLAWNPATRGIAIATRFGNVAQVHEVARPMSARRQTSFEEDAIAGASYAPDGSGMMVVQKDIGGSEFWQLYALADGRMTLLTDGKSRNIANGWSPDGRWLAYTSTRRTGADNDLYLIDPRDPASDRLVARLAGGDWSLAAFAPDGRTAILANRLSVARTDLAAIELTTGRISPIGDRRKPVSYGTIAYAPDGRLWVTSDEDSDFKRLGVLDPASGRFTAVSAEPRWDVESFDIARDGSFIAYSINEGGVSRVRLLDVATGGVRRVSALPPGAIAFSTLPGGPGGLRISPWGEIGLSLSWARAPADVYSIDPTTLAVTRWTESETGGLDPAANVEPQLVETRSFDGEPVSGLLYRPDAARFPGRRPLIVEVHGGPEFQQRPDFRGRGNYYLNTLGVALFYPNVRGSTGYGKRFGALDDGPFRREDAVRDIGAFLDVLAKDARLDATRVGITGGSYGGYMTLASMIHHPARFRAGIEGVGITDWVAFLENTQAYRRDRRRLEYGDERDPRQRAKLVAISPATRAAELKQPLLVLTGGNDPRVPPAQAGHIVRTVRASGGTAWHILAEDEGHGFSKKANQDYVFLASLAFWKAKLLGGR